MNMKKIVKLRALKKQRSIGKKYNQSKIPKTPQWQIL
jgi:hypothetical protein